MTDPAAQPTQTFSGTDFSNNLISDLGPLLALFGEQVATQFMSQSMGWADNILFAMAPLGIITAIVAAIRVGGPGWLKAIIGRARENRAVAEVELMSSTSHEVCELWDGKQVVRITGAPPIRQLIYFTPTKNGKQNHSNIEKGGNIYTLEGAPKIGGGHDGYLRELSKAKFEFKWLAQLKKRGLDPESPSEQKPFGPVAPIKAPSSAPNISLNIHHPIGRRELWAWAAVAILLQSGVLVYDALVTYKLKFKEGGNKVVRYAFPLTATGTLALVLGMLLCSYVIENSTVEEVYQVEGAEARILWLQKKATVSDQSFDSYAIFVKEKSKNISTSRRRVRTDLDREDTCKEDQGLKGDDAPFASEIIAILGVFIGFCGFVVQFVGLRAMHWSASLAQLCVTLVMIVVRAWVRRGLSNIPHAQRLPPGHEIDWLATRMADSEHGNSNLWNKLDNEQHGPTLLHRFWSFVCQRSEEPAPADSFWTQKCFDCGIITDADVSKQDPLSTLGEQQQVSPGAEPDHNPEAMINKAQNLMEVRKRLGALTKWPSPASDTATSVTTAIEIVMNTLYTSDERELFWSMNASSKELVQFRLERVGKEWKADVAEIDAALSLWLFSASEKEQSVSEKRKEDDGSAWLRSGMASRKQSIRIVGPSTKSSRRDMNWWVGNGVTVSKVDEDVDGTAIEIESHRVVGSASSVSNHTDEYNYVSKRQLYQTRQITEDLVSDLATPEEDESNNGGRSLATISDIPLDLLFAQHMFSSFMWAFAKTTNVKRIDGQATVQKNKATPSSNTAWQSFTLQNSILSKMAQRIQRTGLGSLEEIYTSIVPALSFVKKLPEATAVVQLAEEQARRHELSGRWDQAGEVYLWAFRTCITLGSKDRSAIQAAAALTEFLRSISITAEIRKKQHRPKESVEELQDLGSKLSKVLSKFAEENVLRDLAAMYKIQGREEGYSVWKPQGPAGFPRLPNDWPEYQWTALHQAALENRSNGELRRLLEEGGDVNSKDILGWTPLHYAITRGYLRVIEIFLGQSPNPNLTDIAGWTPLHYVAFIRGTASLKIGQSLWNLGADVNVRGRNGLAPLHCAARKDDLEMAEFLIKSGAKLGIRDNAQRTPLHWAAYEGREKFANFLLERGADADTRDEYGRTPLHLAASSGHEEVLKVFLKASKVTKEAKDYLWQTALHLAAVSGHERAVKNLLEAGVDREAQDRDSSTALVLASSEGQLAAVETLLDGRVDQEAKNNNEQTALHQAAFKGHDGVVKALLAAEVDKNAKEKDGLTALHLAARCGHKAVVRVLLAAGVDMEVRDRDEQTALHQVAYTSQVEIAELLLGAGVDKEAKAAHDKTALHLVVGLGSEAVMEALLKAGVNKEAKDEDGATSLLVAVQSGSQKMVKALLEAGADKEARDRLGWTALHTAARRGEKNMVELLLGLGLDMEARDNDQQTVLHTAVGSGDQAITKLLLEAGADKEARDADGWTSLLFAARWGEEPMVRILLEAKVNKEAKNHLGSTALHMASKRGDEAMVNLLLEFGVSKEARDNDQQTALHQAAYAGHEKVIRVLLGAQADKEAKDKDGKTVLHWAAYGGHGAAVKALIGAGVDTGAKAEKLYGQTALHFAAYEGHDSVVLILTEAGVDMEARDEFNGQTVLHKAAFKGHSIVVKTLLSRDADIGARDSNQQTALHQAASGGHQEVVTALINAGVDKEAKDINQQTALHQAASEGHGGVVTVLVAAGADKEAKDIGQQTALHQAAFEGHERVVTVLIAAGADKEAKDIDQQTALHQAASEGHEEVVTALIKAGADKEAKDIDQQTALHQAVYAGHGAVIRVLLGAQVDKEAKGKDGKTALHWAAAQGYEKVVVMLLAAGVEKEMKDDFHGQTALHKAACSGHEVVVKALLEAGADKGARGKDQQTALHRAASKGHDKVVKTLIEAGVDKEAKADRGQRALHLAALWGHVEVVKILLEAGVEKQARDKLYGQTALHLAAFKGYDEVVRILLEAGVEKDKKDKEYEETALHLAASEGHEAVVADLLGAGADMAAQERFYGQTPLHKAAYGGHLAVVKAFLEAGVDKEAGDNEGWRSLFYAAVHGRESVVQILLEAEADMEAKNSLGQTVLQEAARRGHVAVVKLLLEAGAEKDVQNSDRQTALQLADENGHKDVVSMLMVRMERDVKV